MKETLSQLLQRRMGELDLTKAELARASGLSRSYIGNIANETAPTVSGQYDPSPETVAKLAKALQVEEAEILATLGYFTDQPAPASEVFRLPDGVQIIFQKKQKFTPKQMEEISRTVSLIIKGLQEEEEQ